MIVKPLITFDLDNTLWHVDEVIQRATRIQFQWLAQNFPQITETHTEKDFLEIRNHLIATHPSIITDLTELRRLTVEKAALRAGFEKENAKKISQDCFDVFFIERNKVVLFPDTHEVLEELNKHYQLIALSNGNADLNIIGIEQYFLAHYRPMDAGSAKPSPEMFQLALKTANTNAQESIHVGDDLVCDIEGAKALGFLTIFANALKKHSPESETHADATITELKQLPDCIKSLLA